VALEQVPAARAHDERRGLLVELQQKEFAAAERGFTAVKHQREVGTGYFDDVTQVIQAGKSSTTALHGSTEDEQFFPTATPIRTGEAQAAD